MLALVVTMVNLGLWQLRRHDERQALRDQLADGLAVPAVDVASVLGSSDAAGSVGVEDWEYRRLTAQGRLHCSQAVLVRNRTLNGRPGYWVFAPLEVSAVRSDSAADSSSTAGTAPLIQTPELPPNAPELPPGLPEFPAIAPESRAAPAPDSTAPTADSAAPAAPIADFSVMVNLGWLPRELATSGPGATDVWQGDNCSTTAQDSQVAITGLLFLPVGGSGRECDSLAPVCTFARPDVSALAVHYGEQPGVAEADAAQSQPSQLQLSLLPPQSLPQVLDSFYIQLEESAPSASVNLVILGAPEFSLGNHRSYAVQWFIFSTIAAVGYPLILWRNANKRRQASTPAPSQP